MQFSKWHALGNSYLLVERADAGGPLDAGLVRRLCDVRVGVGSDGLLEVVALGDATAEIAVWNPDGSRAEFSGNGSRIAAAWLARRAGVAAVTLTVAGRAYEAVLREDGTIAMTL